MATTTTRRTRRSRGRARSGSGRTAVGRSATTWGEQVRLLNDTTLDLRFQIKNGRFIGHSSINMPVAQTLTTISVIIGLVASMLWFFWPALHSYFG
jgi:hypothetical protein